MKLVTEGRVCRTFIYGENIKEISPIFVKYVEGLSEELLNKAFSNPNVMISESGLNLIFLDGSVLTQETCDYLFKDPGIERGLILADDFEKIPYKPIFLSKKALHVFKEDGAIKYRNIRSREFPCGMVLSINDFEIVN